MQKVILFIAPQNKKWSTPTKIGNLFMNRSAIEEDECNEILKVYQLKNASWPYQSFETRSGENLTKEQGVDFKIVEEYFLVKESNKESSKEMGLGDLIDDGLKAVDAFGNDDLMPHFIFCDNSTAINPPTFVLPLEELIFTRMKKYGIISLLLTILGMNRMNLVTKEKSKQAYRGNLKNEPG